MKLHTHIHTLQWHKTPYMPASLQQQYMYYIRHDMWGCTHKYTRTILPFFNALKLRDHSIMPSVNLIPDWEHSCLSRHKNSSFPLLGTLLLLSQSARRSTQRRNISAIPIPRSMSDYCCCVWNGATLTLEWSRIEDHICSTAYCRSDYYYCANTKHTLALLFI